jgi:hypothetical protein
MRRMAHDDEKLTLDTAKLAVHLTGLQAEVEAKVRLLKRFREHMQVVEASAVGRVDRERRKAVTSRLLKEVDDMLETNRVVRELLGDLRDVAWAVLDDLKEP